MNGSHTFTHTQKTTTHVRFNKLPQDILSFYYFITIISDECRKGLVITIAVGGSCLNNQYLKICRHNLVNTLFLGQKNGLGVFIRSCCHLLHDFVTTLPSWIRLLAENYIKSFMTQVRFVTRKMIKRKFNISKWNFNIKVVWTPILPWHCTSSCTVTWMIHSLHRQTWDTFL